MHVKICALLAPLCLLTACDTTRPQEDENSPGYGAQTDSAGGKADEVDASDGSVLGAACLYADDCGENLFCALPTCTLEGDHVTADGELPFCYGQCSDVERPRQCLPLENSTVTREWTCPGDYECSPESPRVAWSDPEYCENTFTCSVDADCADAGEGWVCNPNGVCGEPCGTRDDCQAGEQCRLGICLAGLQRGDMEPSVSISLVLDNPEYFDGRDVRIAGVPVLHGATCMLEFEGEAIEVLVGTLTECTAADERFVHGPISLGDDGVPKVSGELVTSVCSPDPASWTKNRSC